MSKLNRTSRISLYGCSILYQINLSHLHVQDVASLVVCKLSLLNCFGFFLQNDLYFVKFLKSLSLITKQSIMSVIVCLKFHMKSVSIALTEICLSCFK